MYTHTSQYLKAFSRGNLFYPRNNFSTKNSRKNSSRLVFACSPKVQKDQSLATSKVYSLLDSAKWDDKGLAVAIAQNVDTGAILMQGFVNRDALAATISKKATYYSRSRSKLRTKRETSMNFINVDDIFLHCDRDSIIYLGKPDGVTCHTGAETCYYTSVFYALKNLEALRYTSQNVIMPLTVGGGIRYFTDGNGKHYSSSEVASEYFRSGADKISTGSNAVHAAEEYRKTRVKMGKSSFEHIYRVYYHQAVVVSTDPRGVYVQNPDDVEFKTVKVTNPGPNGEEYARYQSTVRLLWSKLLLFFPFPVFLFIRNFWCIL